MYINRQKLNAVMSYVLCVIIIAAMLFSTLFIVKESNHKCIGAHCPICAELQACVQTINAIGSAADGKILLAIMLFYAVLADVGANVILIEGDTLVSLMVKLTD